MFKGIGQNIASLLGQFLAEVDGRQQADHRAVRAVDQQLSLQTRLDDRCGFDGQLDADHRPANANFANQVALAAEFFEPLAEHFAQPLGGREQLLPLDRVDASQASPGRDRIAAEGGGMHARPQAGRQFGLGQHRSGGQTAADRIGEREDIGRDAHGLIGKPLAAAAAAALHLVEHQEQFMLVGQFPQAGQESLRRGADTRFALDGLDQDRRGLVVDEPGRRLQVAEGGVDESGHERTKPFVQARLGVAVVAANVPP